MGRGERTEGRRSHLRIFCAAAVILALVALVGCGKRRPAPPPISSSPSPGGRAAKSELRGIASFYGDPHNGRPTANGEIFDKHAMTAAHRTLPFNTRVRVQDLDNHRSVVVRINDRGPFVAGRIIDLSEEAARRLGMIGAGTARVRLEILSSPPEVEKSGEYAVQVGAFSDRRNADRLRRQLEGRYSPVTVTPYNADNGLVYRVRVGAENSLERANQLAHKLQGENLQAMVVRRDDR